MKILIIEDNTINMKLASDLMESAGYEVLQAVEAEAGIRLANVEQPELILMDIQLPDIDGITAMRLLKGNEKTRDIKIIALTAFAMKGDRERMLKAGCDGYMAKPIRYKELFKLIKVITGHAADL